VNRFLVRTAVCAGLVASVLSGLAAPALRAQHVSVADNASHAARDKTADALMARRIAIDVDHASIETAIRAAAAGARVQIQYQLETLASSRRVSMHLSDVSLGTALERILAGTGLHVVSDGGTGLVVAVADQEHASRIAGGIITGTVIDASTKRALSGANVVLDDSVRNVRTNDKGEFRFDNVAAGTHRLVARYVGYSRQTKAVTITDEQTVSIDFALGASVNTLNQVVVTATGTQRVRELGHVVATINADSLVKEAPVGSTTELLQSRVPGLQVITGDGGMAGGEITLRLRGTSTTALNPEPIVIVDGVRYQSNNLVERGGQIGPDPRSATGEMQSPLNNLNQNDIATIEVVKGPSASTLYGPDASNGVIVITTKRGAPGKTRFNWYARPVTTSVPKTRIERGNRVWSHDSSGAAYQGQCSLVYQYQYGACILDSITVAPTIVADDRYSILAKSRPTWQYGANISGGTQQIQYYASGNYNSQVGALRVPPALQPFLKQQLGVQSLSDDQLTPNRLQVIGGQTSLTAVPWSTTTANLTVGYVQTDHRTVQTQVFSSQYQGAGAPKTWGSNPSQININDNAYYSAMVLGLQKTTEHAGRFTTALNVTAQLTSWLTGTATFGLDRNGTTTQMVLPAGLIAGYTDGQASDEREDNTGRTGTLALTALARPGVMSFRSTVGVQYGYANLSGVDIYGSGLAPGSTSVATLRNKGIEQLWSETVSLGTYGEEVVGVHERLFLTGSLRIDGSTSLGDKYHPTPYPKLGASWIVSDEPFMPHVPGLTQLRLRTSHGAASRYPTSTMKLGSVDGGAVLVEGQVQDLFERSRLANPTIRPEYSRETEWGADITLVRDIQAGLTWHRRRIDDKIQNFNNTQGLPAVYINVGDQSTHGFEATLAVPLYEAHSVRADLNVGYNYLTDKVLSIGDQTEYRTPFPNGTAIGYQTNAVFGRRVVGVADTVGGHADGIIFTNEVIRDSVNRFLGVTDPPKTLTLTPTVGLWNGRVRLSALFDRQMDFLRFDAIGASCITNALCSAAFVRGSNPIAQARYALDNYEDFLVPGDFTRWRELNVTVNIPQRFLEVKPLHLRFSSASVSLQGRDLALWTKYSGTDPESRSRLDNWSSSGIPQARAWSFRFDITP